jgi:hypothetical protein
MRQGKALSVRTSLDENRSQLTNSFRNDDNSLGTCADRLWLAGRTVLSRGRRGYYLPVVRTPTAVSGNSWVCGSCPE